MPPEKSTYNQVLMIVVISFFVGGLSGAFGSFFMRPYLETTDWGRAFLGNGLPVQMDNDQPVVRTAEESATIDTVRNVSDSVVSIVISRQVDERTVYNQTGPFIFDFWGSDTNSKAPTPPPAGKKITQEIGGGTGFVIDKDGLILTNRHVVSDQKADYTVVFKDGQKFSATVLARDLVKDIAVLKIDAKDLKVAALGDSDRLQIGQTVIAIGNALSEYQNTVTRGVVSGINRHLVADAGNGASSTLDSAIQTDAAINPGNSGGPLLNLNGEVVGINTAMNWQGRDIGFAIPINEAKNAIESIKQYGRIINPWLGVRYVILDKDISEKNALPVDYGALIVKGEDADSPAIAKDSPAEKAGLKEKDIILEVNGQKIDEQHSLVSEVNKFKPDDEISLKVLSEGKEKDVKVTLAERK